MAPQATHTTHSIQYLDAVGQVHKLRPRGGFREIGHGDGACGTRG